MVILTFLKLLGSRSSLPIPMLQNSRNGGGILTSYLLHTAQDS